MRTRILQELIVATSIAAISFMALDHARSEDAASFSDYTRKLPLSAGTAEFRERADTIILISQSEGLVLTVDADTDRVHRRIPVRFDLVDAAQTPDGRWLYIAGKDKASSDTVFAKADLEAGKVGHFTTGNEVDISSIEASDAGDLLFTIGNDGSVNRIDGNDFDKLLAERSSFDLRKIIRDRMSMKEGAMDVAATFSEGFVLVLNEHLNDLAVIDLRDARLIDRLSLATLTRDPNRPYPLVQSVSRVPNRRAKGDRFITSVAVGDFSGGRVVIADLDLNFSSLGIVQTASLPREIIGRSPRGDRDVSPLLMATDAQQKIILVGSRFSRSLVLYTRNGGTIERVGLADLPGEPTAIDVSSDGKRFLALIDDGAGLVVVNNQDAWIPMFSDRSGKDSIRDVQRSLSLLGYPIGVVDGFDGSKTRAALTLFQNKNGLRATGRADEETLKALFGAADYSSQDYRLQFQ